ncbi:MAG: HlyD family efflux transporter periplasmic adaptor subunit [Verrucomicrobia bacterium]|nr:HlyD family efflux transporter periplasmic adaptor subunit [Verrucomicrobiota bacterium]
MDISRPDLLQKKRRKRLIYAVISGATLLVTTIVIARLKPAAPSVDKNLVWIDTVKRGSMVRQVRGIGTLVPEEIRWIAARTQGRVDRIILRPGAAVTPDSVILVLANPTVQQAALDAESELRSAEAEFITFKVQLERGVLDAESGLATAKSAFETNRLQAEVNEDLFKDGLVSALELRRSKVAAEDATSRYEIEKKRYAFTQDSLAPQLAVKQAAVDRASAQAKLRRDDADALNVRASMNGVLQELPVEVGAQVQPGANVARVVDPTRLKAEVRIAETQARDIQIEQPATIDTRNGVIAGRVARIDPSVQNGTVTVDIRLEGELPKGARPALSVDGTIELERLENIIYVGRPASGQERSSVKLFKLSDDVYAQRISVQLGRSSVNTIEIIGGLQPGDRVILSDMSQWDSAERIKLN